MTFQCTKEERPVIDAMVAGMGRPTSQLHRADADLGPDDGDDEKERQDIVGHMVDGMGGQEVSSTGTDGREFQAVVAGMVEGLQGAR